MLPRRHFRDLAIASAISAAMLVAAVTVHGVLFFRPQLVAICDPFQMDVCQFWLLDGGRRAAMLVRRSPRTSWDAPRWTLEFHDLGARATKRRSFALPVSSYCAVISARGNRLFASNPDGTVYALDLDSLRPEPRAIRLRTGGLLNVAACLLSLFGAYPHLGFTVCCAVAVAQLALLLYLQFA